MNHSNPFFLLCLLCLTGCNDNQVPPQTASLTTEENGNSEVEVSSALVDYTLKLNDNAELEYRLHKKGVDPIPPEKGGGYYFSNYFDYCGEDELHLLSEVEGLRSFMMMAGNSFSPAGWKNIGQISGLETFMTQSSDITDEHLIGLKGLLHLEDLQIIMLGSKGNPISHQGLQVLAELPALRRLVLHSRDLNPRACELIGNCTQLRALELRGSVTDECLKPLGKLINLRHLILHGTFSDAGLAYLGDLKYLERLVIHSDRLTGSGLHHFTNATELREFGFSGTPQDNASLKQLDQFPALIILNLASPTVNDVLVMTMPRLPALEALSLRGSSITDAGLDFLVKVRNLTELDLKFTNISNAGLTRLVPLQQLRLLLLRESAEEDLITGKGLAPLTKLPQLEILDLDSINSEILDFQPLAQINSLREVNLNFGTPDIYNRWLELLEQRPDLKKVEEFFPVSRRVGRFGFHTQEIP
ncbi:hypothetical protein [uncultured Gimesia sp.]|uniref:hypothetical protein n=1 Tax=uncultured Gimesia sp. TaxID=1678688 RepID=UPI0030DA1407|tara:strand:+ start:8258 stop:9676 length:1419 start_codon:yes stop_codon:yes gene_type:complete